MLITVALPREVLNRHLVVARYLYESGVQQSYQTGFRRATALLAFHDAIEMVLVLGLQHHDLYSPKRLYSFVEYWKELEAKGIEVTQFSAMQRLNTARVNLKHHASIPGPEIVEEARIQTRVFFIENMPSVFGVNFDEIALSSLVIAPAETRSDLEKAERHMAAKEYSESITTLGRALSRLLRHYRAVREPTFRDRIELDWSVITAMAPNLHAQMSIKRFLDDLVGTINESKQAIRLIGLGLDLSRWERFVSISRPRTPDWSPSLDDCRFCYDVVVDSALRLQEAEVEPRQPG